MRFPRRAIPNLRWRLRATGVAAALAGSLLGGCGAPLVKATTEQVRALERLTIVDAPVEGATPANGATAPPLLSYLRAGDASSLRVIYIHGTPGSAAGWADYLVDPVPGLEAISVDRLGFGQSGPKGGGGEFSLQKQAEAIAPLLVERNGRWPIVVGHSLGGPIAACLCAMHPERVSGLVIVAGSLDPEQENPGLAQRIASLGVVRFFLPRVLDNCMGELDAAKEQTTLLAPLLARVTCPVIVIHGTKDKLVPYENAAYAHRMLSEAASVEVVTLEHQGHFVPWERAEAIRGAVAKLAQEH